MEPLFVGRDDLVGDVLAMLHGARGPAVLAVSGVHGIGKTAFLERLAFGADATRDKTVVVPPPRDMATLSVRGAGFDGDGEAATTDALWRTFEVSRMFMSRMADLTGDRRVFATFRGTAEVECTDVGAAIAGGNTVSAARSSFENVRFTTTITYDDTAVRDKIRSSQAALERAFIQAWELWSAKGNTMLLTVDHFEAVVGTDLGNWLLDMALNLPGLVTVLACTPAALDAFADPLPIEVRWLEPFTLEEVGRYLRERLSPEPVADDVVSVTHHFTDGHPGGVRLVADLLSERAGSGLDAVDLRRILGRLSDEPWALWADLVDLILRSVGSDRLTAAARAGAVANTFDEPLLADLLGTEGAVGTVISQLLGLGLLVRVESEAPLAPRFRLRDFIRRALVRRTQAVAPREWESLHRRAAAHYFERLGSIEEGAGDGYAGWYRYERADWQQAKTEWLYHASMLPGDQELTRARFALVFLEAFYFWGCYQQFQFNRTLLWEWSRSGDPLGGASSSWSMLDAEERQFLDTRDRQLLEALEFILDNYPPGHVKAFDRWDEIRDRLLLIERLCGLGRGGRVRHPDGKRARGFLRVFLAHTQRYQHPVGPDAGHYYAQALEAFVAEEDGWMEAWLEYECADLAVAEGRPGAAVASVGIAAERLGALVAAGDDWDEELLANLCRVAGDVVWDSGDVDTAMAFYERAALHAYRFQGLPHEPDEYTQRFYGEITSRVAQRLAELVASGRSEEAIAHAEGLRAVFGIALSAGGGADHGLDPTDPRKFFPAGPEGAELHSQVSAFMDRWRRFDDRMPDSDRDLEAVLALVHGKMSRPQDPDPDAG